MRRALTLLLTLSIALGLAACVSQSRQDTVLHSLGKYEQKQFLTRGEFQDYTDFGIYTCKPKSIKESDYFSKAPRRILKSFATSSMTMRASSSIFGSTTPAMLWGRIIILTVPYWTRRTIFISGPVIVLIRIGTMISGYSIHRRMCFTISTPIFEGQLPVT